MNRNILSALAMVLAVCGVAAVGYAETAVTSPAPMAATSAPTPVISTSEGTVSSIDVNAASPWIKIKDAAGKEWTIMIDPASSSVWKGGNKATWVDIQVGNNVKVRHTEKDGKAVVKTIEIA